MVGSNTVVSDDQGNLFRGREYPWGVVNIEDEVKIKYELKKQEENYILNNKEEISD